ncbi:MAG TPA: hypothetical protein VM324_06780 [Egibacteraceae bacterium]|nr:hypothetical protein [Egibacteraceae bacterium]
MWARWVLAGLVLVCAGCELRLDVEAALDRDGGGRLEVAVTADDDLLTRARTAGAEPLDDLAAAGRALGRGWDVADTTDARGRRTVALAARARNPAGFQRLAADLAGALAAPEVALLSPLRVTVDGERLVVEGAAGLQPTEAVAELGLTPEQAVTLLRDEAAFGYAVRLALPGPVLGSTAERQDDGVLTWVVEPGEQVTVHAVGERPPPPLWPLVVGAVLGMLFAALVLRRLVVVRRRR